MITREEVIAYIQSADYLNNPFKFSEDTWHILSEWKTLLDRPVIVSKLLELHEKPLTATLDKVDRPFDKDALKAELSEQYPNVLITDELIMLVVGYGSSAHQFLSKLNNNQDLGLYYTQPHLLLENPLSLRTPGTTIKLPGASESDDWEVFTIKSCTLNPKTAELETVFIGPDRVEKVTYAQDRKYAIEIGLITPPQIVKKSDIGFQVASPGEGRVDKWHVAPGHIITAENCIQENGKEPLIPLGDLEIQKIKQPLMLDRRYIGQKITSINVEENAVIDEVGQLLITLEAQH